MRTYFQVKPYYTLTELGEVTESNRKRVKTTLRNAGIPMRRTGKYNLVFVIDIQERLPELWKSLVSCERVRAINRALQSKAGLRPRAESAGGDHSL